MHDDDIESRLRAAMEEATRPVTGTGVDEREIHRTVARRRQLRRFGLAGGGVAVAAAALAAVLLIEPGDEKVQTTPGDTTEVPETTARPVDSTTTTTATSTTTADQLPAFPDAYEDLVHGGTAWVVYLAVSPDGRYDTMPMTAANEALVNAGYGAVEPPAGGSIGCDQGAGEALDVDDDVARAAFEYFESEALANQAKSAFEARGTTVVAVVPVQTFCLD